METNRRENGTDAGRCRRRGETWIEAGDLLGDGIGLTFTDRSGGVSPAPYETLNLAYHTGDEPANVSRNRRKVARYLGIPEGRFVFFEQVHGLKVARACIGNPGEVTSTNSTVLEATDGAFTLERGIVLSLLTADCVPVAIAETGAGAVALLHAGWRGTIGDIVGIAMDMMEGELGLDREEAKVVLGPAIAPCCYCVDEGRARLFVERYGGGGVLLEEGGKMRLDLMRANVLNLIRSGVKEENISLIGGCTCCDSRFFSFRRDGVTGRQGAFLCIR